ncbi:MAG: glycosyltransferase family 1 protein [Steroidobacteraceae bacterium]
MIRERTLVSDLAPDTVAARAAAGRRARLRVGVACFASDGGRSGIGQYLLNVVRRLPLVAPDDEFVVFAPRRDASLWSGLPPRVTVELVADRHDSPVQSLLWHSLELPRRLRAHDCNVAFLPAGNRRLGVAYGVPSVATVHDLSQLHVPQKYDLARMIYATRVLPALIGRQDRVVTVSSSTRADVLEHTAVTADRVSVVPNGVDLSRYSARHAAGGGEAHDGRGGPYLLYVARLEHPGKNHVTLLEAYARLKASGLPHRLVLAGPRWSGADAIDAAVVRLGLAGEVVFTGFLDADALPGLYRGASAFVFPSLYEGFGIPLLEAMASGVPCCVSNVSSLPEVAGDAALLFDPRDVSAIAEAMHRLLTDDVLRARLRARGIDRSGRYTWERSALGVIDACRAAAASRR